MYSKYTFGLIMDLYCSYIKVRFDLILKNLEQINTGLKMKCLNTMYIIVK